MNQTKGNADRYLADLRIICHLILPWRGNGVIKMYIVSREATPSIKSEKAD